MNDELNQLMIEIASIKSEDVFQFPMLQEKCRGEFDNIRGERNLCDKKGIIRSRNLYEVDHLCKSCQARKWVPVVSFDALFEALDSIGFNLVNFSTYGKTAVVETAISVRSDGWKTGRAEAETITEARMWALAKALKNTWASRPKS